MMREDDGKEAHVKEAYVETKEELKGGEVREEVCRSATAVGRGDMAHERERK